MGSGPRRRWPRPRHGDYAVPRWPWAQGVDARSPAEVTLLGRVAGLRRRVVHRLVSGCVLTSSARAGAVRGHLASFRPSRSESWPASTFRYRQGSIRDCRGRQESPCGIPRGTACVGHPARRRGCLHHRLRLPRALAGARHDHRLAARPHHRGRLGRPRGGALPRRRG